MHDMPVRYPLDARTRAAWQTQVAAATETRGLLPLLIRQRQECTVNGVLNQLCEGTNGDDIIIGTPGDDIILGQEGHDTLQGKGGNDLLCGGSDDALDGRGGDDTLVGDEGNNTLLGRGGQDLLQGGEDNDQLKGGAGTDTCVDGETLLDCEL